MRYDIAIIGNDEAAIEVACLAGSTGQRVALALPEQRHSSWMMEQALRRLVTELTVEYSVERRLMLHRCATPRLVQRLLASALNAETSETLELLERLGVDVVPGESSFLNRTSVSVTSGISCKRTIVDATNIVVGTGVRRAAVHHPQGLLSFQCVESVLEGRCLPESLIVLGGEGFGAGISSLLSLFGVQTSLLAHENNDCDLLELAEDSGVQIVHHPSDLGLTSDGVVSPEEHQIVDCRRTMGFTEHLGLRTIGVEPDEHGQLWCAANLETWCSGVFGIGSVVGFSSDAADHPTVQAERVLSGIQHRIRKPKFLRSRSGVFAAL
jgi:pyruvate/2-oxoglutarate dehydrogenase complex dihydrolipoamide dehydrogenase (E3) component